MTTRTVLLASSVLLLAACAPAARQPSAEEHAAHSADRSAGADAAATDRLTSSPRHQEWVDVKNGERVVRTFVVYPQTADKVPVVVLIHENKGLSDWMRAMADEVAEAGYIAVAPDLLSGFSATQKSTEDFATPDDATKAISALKPEQVASDLQAVADWAKAIPSSDGKLVSAGFCWGGGQSFRFAARRGDLAAALVFYGPGPQDAAEYAKITAPVFGFYGGADERINATIPQSEEAMTAAGKRYDYKIYDGAGHAFMRLGEDPAGEQANIAARAAAWTRMKKILSEI